MVQSTITCPYCGTEYPIATVQHTRRLGLSRIISVGGSSTRTQPSYEVHCDLCGRMYRYIRLTDLSWVKNKLKLSRNALTSLKSFFNEDDLDTIFTHVIGITRPMKRQLGFTRPLDNALHICFKYGEKRAFLACFQERNLLMGIELYRS